MNGAAVITEQGMHGITFLRGGVPTECDQFDFDCMHTDAYARDWNNTMLWLDAAAAVGVKVLMNIGVDKLSSCRSGWIDPVLRPVCLTTLSQHISARGH